jgi:hypothetical protein
LAAASASASASLLSVELEGLCSELCDREMRKKTVKRNAAAMKARRGFNMIGASLSLFFYLIVFLFTRLVDQRSEVDVDTVDTWYESRKVKSRLSLQLDHGIAANRNVTAEKIDEGKYKRK